MFDRGIKNILMKVNASSKKSSSSRFWWLLLGAGISFFLINFFILFTLIIHLNIFDIFIHFSPKSGVSGFNILAFGIDDTTHSKRSDSIIVVHLDKENDHIGALSIPRDTRVTIPSIGRTRINHAFSHGGIDLLKESVSQFLGIPINYYVKIDLSGVEKLVNALGGIEVFVEKSLNYVDYAGDLYIDIPKGKQVLKGKKVMEYLRFRHDEEGDIGRIRRQQLFLDHLVKKILSFDGVLKLPEIIKTAKSIVTTDLSFVQMLSLTRDFKHAVKQDSISKATVPGSASLVGGAYYWKPNVTALDKVVEDTLYGLSSKTTSLVSDVQLVSSSVKKKQSFASTKTLSPSDSLVLSVPDKKQPDLKENQKEALAIVEPLNKTSIEKKEDVAHLDRSVPDDTFVNKAEASDHLDKAVIVSSESLDDISLTDYQDNLIYSEDLSKTFDVDINSSDTVSNAKVDSVVSKAGDINSSDTVPDAKVDSGVSKTGGISSDPVAVIEESRTITTERRSLSESSDNSQMLSQDRSQLAVTMDRRLLFAKEVKRVASTGLLHDDPKFDGLKCEVLNGIGVPGVAKFAAKVFKTLGMVVPRFANAGHFDYAKTMIVDWRGSVDQSLELAHLLEIDPANIIVYDLPHKPLDFTVVLGKDWLDKKSLLEYIYETFKTPDSF